MKLLRFGRQSSLHYCQSPKILLHHSLLCSTTATTTTKQHQNFHSLVFSRQNSQLQQTAARFQLQTAPQQESPKLTLERELTRLKWTKLNQFDTKQCLDQLEQYLTLFNSKDGAQSSVSDPNNDTKPMNEALLFHLLTKILKNPMDKDPRTSTVLVFRFCVKHNLISRSLDNNIELNGSATNSATSSGSSNVAFIDLLICCCIKNRQTLLFDDLNRYVRNQKLTFTKHMLQYQMSAYIRANYTNHAMQIFETLVQSESSIDLPFYTILLDHLRLAIKEANHYREYGFTVLNHLRDKRIPNHRLLHSIFSLLSTLGDSELTTWWFNRSMNNMKFAPDVKMVTAMIQSMKGTGNIDAALSFIRQMERDHGIRADELLMNSLLNCCNSFDQAMSTLRLIETEFNTCPNTFHCSTLIKLAQNESDLQSVTTLMQQRSVPLSNVTFTEIITFYCRQKRRDQALVVYQHLKSLAERNSELNPTIFTVSQLLSAFKDDAQVSNQLYHDTEQYGLDLTRGLLLQLLHSSSEFRQKHIHYIMAPDEHVDHLRSIHKRSPSFFSQLLKWMSRNGDRRLNRVKEQLIHLRINVK